MNETPGRSTDVADVAVPASGEAGPTAVALRLKELERQPLIAVPRTQFWQAWTARHLVALVLFTVVLLFVFHSAAGSPPWQDRLWASSLGVLAVVGAVVWTTYVPTTGGERQIPATPCSSMAGFHVLMAAALLSMNPTLLTAGIVLMFEGAALYMRTSGTCGAR